MLGKGQLDGGALEVRPVPKRRVTRSAGQVPQALPRPAPDRLPAFARTCGTALLLHIFTFGTLSAVYLNEYVPWRLKLQWALLGHCRERRTQHAALTLGEVTTCRRAGAERPSPPRNCQMWNCTGALGASHAHGLLLTTRALALCADLELLFIALHRWQCCWQCCPCRWRSQSLQLCGWWT